jgi:hypothetical protein
MGHAEPMAAEMKLADARVTHVDSAGAITDIRTRPQLAEMLARGRKLVDQRPQPRIIPIARGDLPQPVHHVFSRHIPIDIELAGGRFEKAPAQEVFSDCEFG